MFFHRNFDGMLLLSPYVRVGLSDEILFLGFGSLQQKIIEPQHQQLLLAACRFWLTPHSLYDTVYYLEREINASLEDANQTANFLLENHYLIQPNMYMRDDRYSRHALFYALSGADPRIVQERLAACHVVVYGCGGIGNQVAATLATAGIGKLTLTDGDQIEASNLTRQILFAEEDLGCSKAIVLQRELRRRASNTIIEVIEKCLLEKDLERLPTCDLLILTADSPGLVQQVNYHCVARRMPFLNIGYINDIAVWGPFVIPGKSGCLSCRSLTVTQPKTDVPVWALISEINNRYQAPSMGPINMLAAAHGTLDALRYLGEFGEISSLNQRIGIWTHDLHIERQACPRIPNCSVCGGLT